MKNASMFNKLDLRQGYHQVRVEEEDKCKTAFWGPFRQFYEWNVVPYGLKNAPPFFQRTTDNILAVLSHARCYIDDIINWSTNFDDHILHLQKVFHRLRKQRLKNFKNSYRQMFVFCGRNGFPWPSYYST